VKAIISDIHANLEALRAVLADIEARGVREIICLGDIIGYGPQPAECVDLCQDFSLNLLGNHEEAVLVGAVGFNPKAAAAVEWTRDQFLSESVPEEVRNRRWNFLGGLKIRSDEGDVSYVHGSPREPTREYVFRSDVLDREKMADIFDGIRQICFAGHTHAPGVFTADGEYLTVEDCEGEWSVQKARALVNVGSVGQPRDGDCRASYVTFHDGRVRFHRVPYDIEKAIAAFQAVDALPAYLALRLREGR
jgi:diadenosine tetraphosphatase ApaH/serine/threonine PP2A family protein phosphatase